MTDILQYTPGQLVTILLETLNASGVRADGYTPPDGYPIITNIYYPDFSLFTGYPQNMEKLDTGLYYFQFSLPTGAAAVGSYLVDGYHHVPGTSDGYSKSLYQILVNAPFGIFGATSF